jgi:hypothetical protein
MNLKKNLVTLDSSAEPLTCARSKIGYLYISFTHVYIGSPLFSLYHSTVETVSPGSSGSMLQGKATEPPEETHTRTPGPRTTGPGKEERSVTIFLIWFIFLSDLLFLVTSKGFIHVFS